MAEPKSKGTNGNHVSEKSINKNSKLWQLLALAKEVSKDVDAIQDYDKTIEGRRALEQELEAKSEDNKKLRNLNDKVLKEFSEHKVQARATTQSLVDGFEQRVKAYESDRTEFESMSKEIVEMREKLEASEASQKAKIDEAEKLKQLLESAERNSHNLASEMKEMTSECEIHRSRMQTSVAELHACKTKLSIAQGDLGEDFLHDYGPEGLKKLGLDLRALSKKLHALATEYFNDQDGAEDAASEIQDLGRRFRKVPLSIATTRAAAQMRCAVAEAVIAEVLMTQIFVPFYLTGSTMEAASSLLSIFEDNEQKRTVYRCLILRSTTEDVTRVQDDIVRKASNKVRSDLHPLVVPYKQAGFFQAVPAFFKEAVMLWADVQRSRDLITAEAPDVNEVQPPGKYDDYDQNSLHKGAKGPKGTIAAVLFPQVSTQEDLIFNGMALWSIQTVQVQDTPANGSNGGEPMKPSPSRRRSVVVPEGGFRNK